VRQHVVANLGRLGELAASGKLEQLVGCQKAARPLSCSDDRRQPRCIMIIRVPPRPTTTDDDPIATATSARPGPTTPSLTSPRSGSSAGPSSAASSTNTSGPHRSQGQDRCPSSGTPLHGTYGGQRAERSVEPLALRDAGADARSLSGVSGIDRPGGGPGLPCAGPESRVHTRPAALQSLAAPRAIAKTSAAPARPRHRYHRRDRAQAYCARPDQRIPQSGIATNGQRL
jgi:hypothetical protein